MWTRKMGFRDGEMYIKKRLIPSVENNRKFEGEKKKMKAPENFCECENVEIWDEKV